MRLSARKRRFVDGPSRLVCRPPDGGRSGRAQTVWREAPVPVRLLERFETHPPPPSWPALGQLSSEPPQSTPTAPNREQWGPCFSRELSPHDRCPP
ncbi:uncharacterized protein B0I36DRAFT_92797 [Microdochium trichocladiopsis]|uniref:Uncharacterized protein n=1 Tax=Microdochium trichocladiopsis TaxID=1682393 RepID=A0A9P8YBQ5_9PEZI|nr:uncharacterized protein B0I36DRAFT_92797 [Microdochium trichocladiopsis]KAH7035451.1 hypothetical protein B0I36DRAFT_92797 [Microdochium trichocladiopsis]